MKPVKDVMICAAAAAISFIVAFYEGRPEEFFEPFLILGIVIINAIMVFAGELGKAVSA